jgi:hypothetical protein
MRNERKKMAGRKAQIEKMAEIPWATRPERLVVLGEPRDVPGHALRGGIFNAGCRVVWVTDLDRLDDHVVRAYEQGWLLIVVFLGKRLPASLCNWVDKVGPRARAYEVSKYLRRAHDLRPPNFVVGGDVAYDGT